MSSLLSTHHYLKGHSRAVQTRQLGDVWLPKAGLGYQSWKCGGMSAQLCELDSHQCMKGLLNKPHSLRS